MKKKQLFMVFVLALVVVGTVGVPAASAQTHKPTITTQDQNTDNNKPGWGFGDKNHHHEGPPGQSVRPGDGDNDRDNQNTHISSAQFQQFFTELRQLFSKYFG